MLLIYHNHQEHISCQAISSKLNIIRSRALIYPLVRPGKLEKQNMGGRVELLDAEQAQTVVETNPDPRERNCQKKKKKGTRTYSFEPVGEFYRKQRDIVPLLEAQTLCMIPLDQKGARSIDGPRLRLLAHARLGMKMPGFGPVFFWYQAERSVSRAVVNRSSPKHVMMFSPRTLGVMWDRFSNAMWN